MERTRIQTPEDLGSRIRERRTGLHLTQNELAEAARVTLRFVSELERGKASAQLTGIQRVLAELGLGWYLETR